MNKEVVLSSGAKLEITICSFQVCNSLVKALLKQAKNIKIEGDMELDLKEAIKGGQYNFFKDIVCSLISSDEIESLLFKCFERCLYNKKKVNADLFDNDIDARGDYFEVAWEVGKFNVSPFTKNLLSKFSTIIQQTSTNIPK
jgi:hypothetical protein